MPHLIVLAPDSDRGRRIPLDRDYLVVGRAPTCDVRFDDPRVSRTHAALQRRGNTVYVEDLGSSAGTFVNGVATTAARELRVGDVLTFASVAARLESDGAVADDTGAMPVRSAGATVVHYIDEQRAEVISNVDRDQYMSHVQYVNQQRENFLREVAATKTKERWLTWIGLVLVVAGFGLFAAADLTSFGQAIEGIPFWLVSWALATLGTMLLTAGIVLHIVATSRRRRAYREFPALPPWQGADPSRG